MGIGTFFKTAAARKRAWDTILSKTTAESNLVHAARPKHFDRITTDLKYGNISSAEAQVRYTALNNSPREYYNIANRLDRGEISRDQAQALFDNLKPSNPVAEIKNEGAERLQEAIAEREERLMAARTDRQVAVENAKTEKAISDLNRNWFQRHKILTGLGALGAGGLAYNAFGRNGGVPVNTGQPFTAEEAGSRAAMMDALRDQAANLNFNVANQNERPDTRMFADSARYDGMAMGNLALETAR